MSELHPTPPAVFVKNIFPVPLLNQQVYYEHGGDPFKGLLRMSKLLRRELGRRS